MTVDGLSLVDVVDVFFCFFRIYGIVFQVVFSIFFLFLFLGGFKKLRRINFLGGINFYCQFRFGMVTS